MTTPEFSSPEEKRLLRNLYAFSRGLYNRLYKSEVNNRGKSFSDYVIEGLLKFFQEPEKFDPSKSTLEYYLKYNIIRHSLYNDLPPDVKRAYLLQRQQGQEEVLIIPDTEMVFDPDEVEVSIATLSDHDRKLLFAEIEKCIDGDSVVEQIYLAVAHEKFNISDRAEICKECGIAEVDFDNARKRFVTVLKKVFKKLDLI